mgnify:CR=1 FL=1
MRKIMACLDVGSDVVKLVVGEMVKKKLNILAVCDAPSSGVSNGLVLEPSRLLEVLKGVVQKAQDMIGLPIHQMIVSVPSNKASFAAVTGTVNIENEGGLINGKDVIRALNSAIKSKRSETMEYISVMPTSFTLDDDRVVRDPKGLTSSTLTVRGVMVSAPKKNIYPILACLERLNIEVLDIAVDAIGDYFTYKTKECDKSVGVLVNLGHEKTTLSVFNKSVLTNSVVLPVGGRNVDSDIAYIYKVTALEAKNLKEHFALAHKNLAQTSEFMEVYDTDKKVVKVSQLEISEIVQSRFEQIFNLIKKEINYLTKKEISYIIFTGGLTECKDFQLVLNENFKNARLGTINEIGVRNNKYSSCVGLIKFYAYSAQLKDKDYSIFSIDEQQLLSGNSVDGQNENVISKLFGYIFNG